VFGGTCSIYPSVYLPGLRLWVSALALALEVVLRAALFPVVCIYINSVHAI